MNARVVALVGTVLFLFLSYGLALLGHPVMVWWFQSLGVPV